MKVLVIGATGQTGRRAIPLLLKRGDEVTAFARMPAAVTEKHERLHVVQGDARDAASIERAVKGQDAVFVAFGPRSLKKDDIQEVMMRNLLAAMKAHGVKRLVNLSAWGIDETGAPTFWLFRRVLAPLLLGRVFADKRRAEALLFSSGLDFVNVRPGMLRKSPGPGGARASADGAGLKQYLHYDDLAAFMVEQLSDPTWVGKSPFVGY